MRRRVAVLPLLCLGLIGYFGYHLVIGDHGLRSRARLEKQIRLLERDLAGLTRVKTQFERDTALLAPGNIERDMLDERARAILNFAHPNDIVILTGKSRSGGLR